MPVFGPGGDVVAAIELAVHELGHELQPIMAALAIASRSLSRELAGDARSDHRTRSVAMVGAAAPIAVG
jgi:hypothetical protein